MAEKMWQARHFTYVQMIDSLDTLMTSKVFRSYIVHPNSNIECEAIGISSIGGLDGESDDMRGYTLKNLNPFLRRFLNEAKTSPYLKIGTLELILDAPDKIRDQYGVGETKEDGIPIRVGIDRVPLQVKIAARIQTSDNYSFKVRCKELERRMYESIQTNRFYRAHQRWEKTILHEVTKKLGPQKPSR